MQPLIAFIESIPALVKLVQLFVDKWQEYQFSKIQNKYDERSEQRSAIINAIKKAETLEEKKALVRALYNLTRNFDISK